MLIIAGEGKFCGVTAFALLHRVLGELFDAGNFRFAVRDRADETLDANLIINENFEAFGEANVVTASVTAVFEALVSAIVTIGDGEAVGGGVTTLGERWGGVGEGCAAGVPGEF